MKKQDNYILFIDESGKSKLSDEGDEFLLSGVVIDKDLHTALSHYMLSLKEKSFIPVDENIHAFDLFEGEREKLFDDLGRALKNADGTYRHARIPYSRIDTFFNRLCSLIEGADATGFVYRVNKNRYKDQIGRAVQREGSTNKAVLQLIKRKGLNDFLYESLARKMILEFGHFLETKDAVGEIIAESRRNEDTAVLNAFQKATESQIFNNTPRFQSWSKSCAKRIHSITFQNKKGLSFGLEVADMFGWANFNHTFGRSFPCNSLAKIRRGDQRIAKANRIRADICRNNTEVVSHQMIKGVALDRISEFSKVLDEYRFKTFDSSGTPPGIPGRP